LMLPSLDLVYDPVTKTHEAPYQMKANGGIFLIDDFGRQQVRPRDLLNRWIMPLERQVDYLTLKTGKKIEVPFDVLIMFSTNLEPKELVDEAFLRRIPHKIEIPDPGFNEYREIFKRQCAHLKIAYDEQMLVYLLREYYLVPEKPLRAVHPRDLLQQLNDIARYRHVKAELSKELIDEACRTYFLRY
jgi:predicted ATPase with chaperone activity